MQTCEMILTPERIDRYERDGYLIVEGLMSPDETDAMREHFMRLHDGPPIPGCFEPVPMEETGGDALLRSPRMMMPHRVDELSYRYLLDARFESILRTLMGDEPLAAQSMFYFKPPGARGQALHQDNFYLKVKPGTCMAAWLSVDDAERENGGMFVVPGSHKLDTLCPHLADMTRSFSHDEVDVPAGLKPVPADMNAGDVMFFNGSVIHGSWPNSSPDRFRRAFICHYVPESSVEMSHWYYPLVRFNGETLERGRSEAGGPCGIEERQEFERALSAYHAELSQQGIAKRPL